MSSKYEFKHSSPSRTRRNAYRRSKLQFVRSLSLWLQANANQPGGDVQKDDSPLQLLWNGFVRILDHGTLGVATCFAQDKQSSSDKTPKRQRDVFPLPHVYAWPLDVTPCTLNICLSWANACISALNHLYADFKAPRYRCLKAPNLAQQAVHKHVCERTERFVSRLGENSAILCDWHGSFSRHNNATGADFVPLRAAAVDLPTKASGCDPTHLVSESFNQSLIAPHTVFPNDRPIAPEAGLGRTSNYDEYVSLTARQLKCGKVLLRHEVIGMGSIFARAKTHATRQRELWNGHFLSLEANPPPKPRRLASPASFLDLEVRPDEFLYYTKRDASCYFDTLRAPSHLRPWFGRPPVKVCDLMLAGEFSNQDILGYLDDEACDCSETKTIDKNTILFPVSTCWPQGFSWSSAVAQECTIAVCLRSGLCEDQLLSVDHEPPSGQQELAVVCTDDVIMFHRSRDAGTHRANLFDVALNDAGAILNHEKSINQSLDVTALGCDLSNHPAKAEPSARKAAEVVCNALDLLSDPRASPKAISSLLGSMQWFSLLQRGMYSCFHHVYRYVQQKPEDNIGMVPNNVLDELLTFVLLMPLLTVSFERQWLPEVIACDASCEYGFGVCAADVDAKASANFGKWSERRGDFVRLFPNPDDPPEKDRLGVPHRLDISAAQFKTVISAKAQYKAHSASLEAHALLLAMRWAARGRHRHHHRIPFLVDAKSVVGSASKGRSSSPLLRGPLRAIAALCLATDCLLRIIYIPSESNPSDPPSRGVRRRRTVLDNRRRRTPSSRFGTRTDRRLARLELALSRLQFSL